MSCKSSKLPLQVHVDVEPVAVDSGGEHERAAAPPPPRETPQELQVNKAQFKVKSNEAGASRA